MKKYAWMFVHRQIIILQIFHNAWEKNAFKELTLCCMGCSLLSNLWYNFMQITAIQHSLIMNKIFKLRLNEVDMSFENWGISLYGWYPRISPSFSRIIFSHVIHLDQLRATKSNWWIITWFDMSLSYYALFPLISSIVDLYTLRSIRLYGI